VQRQAETGRSRVIEELAIHASRFPAIGRMANSAVAVERPLMYGWLGVASGAFRRRLLETLGSQLAHCSNASHHPLSSSMALHALHLGMLALQRKRRLRMVELHHTIGPVVAGNAILTEILNMLCHELLIVLSMAGRAFLV
jgi:hypothetical protein